MRRLQYRDISKRSDHWIEIDDHSASRLITMLRKALFSSPLRFIAMFWATSTALFFLDIYGAYTSAPNKALLLAFMTMQITMLLVIDAISAPSIKPILTSEKSAKTYFRWALIVSAILLPLNIHFYTGSQLSDFFTMLTDPVEAYARMHKALIADRSERLDFLILKLTVSWLTVALVPLAVILKNQGRLSWTAFISALSLSFVLSIFRGTDKEIGDIIIFILAGMFLKPASREKVVSSTRQSTVGFRIFSKEAFALLVVLIFFFYFFAFRKIERLSAVTFFCFENSDACMVLPDGGSSPLEFLVMMLYSYLTHGYYGLASSFDANFNPCPFIGHSSVLLYLAGFAGITCEATVLEQLNHLGWAPGASWSTGFVSLANDFGFLPTFLQIASIAIMMKVFHRSYKQHGCIISGVLFSLNFFILFYMVANLQLQQVGDQYFGYIFLNIFAFLILLLKSRRQI